MIGIEIRRRDEGWTGNLLERTILGVSIDVEIWMEINRPQGFEIGGSQAQAQVQARGPGYSEVNAYE